MSMPADFDRLLQDTQDVLAGLRAGTPPEDAEVLRGEGVAADGRVRAVVVSGGTVESVEIDPRAMRMASVDLGAAVAAAVNAAMTDLMGKVRAAAPQGVDPQALKERLNELHNQSARQMAMFTQGIADAVAEIKKTTG
jgi:DNA-binding protein YbaB